MFYTDYFKHCREQYEIKHNSGNANNYRVKTNYNKTGVKCKIKYNRVRTNEK